MGRIEQYKELILDAVFPRSCVLCEKEGNLLCDTCKERHVYKQPEIQFKKRAGYHARFSSYYYHDPIIRRLLKAWKYHFDEEAWSLLQGYVKDDHLRLSRWIEVGQFDVVAPIPLHRKRLCERGFDQAKEIAGFLSNMYAIPCLDVLKRVRGTGRQSERSNAERKHILAQKPFRLTRAAKGVQRILLVDDVWTTGSTAIAAANCLAKEGKDVWVYTIARG